MSELRDYVEQLIDRHRTALGRNLISVYLHGSAAMDAFIPTRSDIDVLTVSASPLSSRAKHALATSLSETTCPSPGVGLEMSVVTAGSARAPSGAPAFEVHIATAEGSVVDGAGHEGDPDLVAHFAMTRARGVALLGPPPTQILAAVESPRLLRCFADDILWAVDRGLSGYAVLNACRALRSEREGGLYSKLEGARWALHHGVGGSALVEAALRWQLGAEETVDATRAAAFALAVRESLLEAAAEDG